MTPISASRLRNWPLLLSLALLASACASGPPKQTPGQAWVDTINGSPIRTYKDFVAKVSLVRTAVYTADAIGAQAKLGPQWKAGNPHYEQAWRIAYKALVPLWKELEREIDQELPLRYEHAFSLAQLQALNKLAQGPDGQSVLRVSAFNLLIGYAGKEPSWTRITGYPERNSAIGEFEHDLHILAPTDQDQAVFNRVRETQQRRELLDTNQAVLAQLATVFATQLLRHAGSMHRYADTMQPEIRSVVDAFKRSQALERS